MAPLNVYLPKNVTQIAQLALGGAVAYGGYQVASNMIRDSYREDMLGDPTRVIETDGNTMIYQTREPQADRLSNYLIGAGAVSAFAGGILAFSAPAGISTIKAIARNVGGLGMIALGFGAIAGATATSAQWSGSDFQRLR